MSRSHEAFLQLCKRADEQEKLIAQVTAKYTASLSGSAPAGRAVPASGAGGAAVITNPKEVGSEGDVKQEGSFFTAQVTVPKEANPRFVDKFAAIHSITNLSGAAVWIDECGKVVLHVRAASAEQAKAAVYLANQVVKGAALYAASLPAGATQQEAEAAANSAAVAGVVTRVVQTRGGVWSIVFQGAPDAVKAAHSRFYSSSSSSAPASAAASATGGGRVGSTAADLEAVKAHALAQLALIREALVEEEKERKELKAQNADLAKKSERLEYRVKHLEKMIKEEGGQVWAGLGASTAASPAVAPKAEAAAAAAGKGDDKKSKKEAKKDAKKDEKAAKGKEEAAAKSPKTEAKKGGDKNKDDKGAKGGDAKKDEDKLVKAALKEGGKKGQDICGLNEMGGVVFFHLAVQDALGRWDLMDKVMSGFNTEVDETAEDRKGGAGHLCKALLSAGDNSLLIHVHVPKEHASKTSAKQWAAALAENMGKTKTLLDTDEFVKIECPADPNNNLYPLKMRDAAIGQGFAFLRKKNLVMEDDDDDDVDYGEMAAGADISWGGADY